jgi:hypothetical protein
MGKGYVVFSWNDENAPNLIKLPQLRDGLSTELSFSNGGISGTVPASQEQDPEFKSQYCKTNKQNPWGSG